MVKNQKGFTLVEVIVVAVIVAVLAAVAIPLYNGYIADARQNVINNIAADMATFCGTSFDSDVPIAAGAKAAGAVLIGAGTPPTQYKVPAEVTAVVAADNRTVTVTHTKGLQTATKP